MSDKLILLKCDDVISINNHEDKIILPHLTFKVKEFIEDLIKKIGNNEESGVSQVLKAKSLALILDGKKEKL